MLGVLDVSKFLGFFEFFTQLGEPASKRGLGLIVEHLTRVTQPGDLDPCRFEILATPRQSLDRLTAFVLFALACNSTEQIENVEFCVRMTQQMSDIPESPR